MFETVSEIVAWALCGGILVAVVLVWVYVYLRLLWMSIKGWRAERQR